MKEHVYAQQMKNGWMNNSINKKEKTIKEDKNDRKTVMTEKICKYLDS